MMRRITILLLGLLAAILVIEAAYSVRWPIAHDEAPLFYESFLMHSEGRVPYRDLFDFQMPGTYTAFYFFGSLTAYDALRVRILDLAILAALLLLTFFLMRRFGRLAALAAALMFGLKYLEGGPSMALQREYLLLLCIAPATWIYLRDVVTPRHRLLCGFLFGLAALIKPQAGLGLLPIAVIDILGMVRRRERTLLESTLRSLLPLISGAVVPIVFGGLWLAREHALTPSIDIARNYWPLYAHIDGAMEVHAGASHWPIVLEQTFHLGGNGLWLLPAALAVYLQRSRNVALLAGLAASFAIYPALSGQFFAYHYLPFVYFIILTSCAALAGVEQSAGRLPYAVAPLVLLFVALTSVRPAEAFVRQLQGKAVVTSTDRAQQIAVFLEKNLLPGDTVQPLDWTGGSLLAMLDARARLATPYVFDFYFYHDVSTTYIQELRNDFIDKLQAARPRFVIEVTAIDKPWVSGDDTSRDFPELRAFLQQNYSITIRKSDYVIYRRN